MPVSGDVQSWMLFCGLEKSFPLSPSLKKLSSSAVKLQLRSNAEIHLEECI